MHQNAQRLLRPLLVANPFAPSLTFLDDRTRTRRDHMKYLTLIRSIALLYQYQRPVKTTTHHGEPLSFIEVVPADIEVANRLCHEVLGRSLDELPPQTRRLLMLIEQMVSDACKAKAIERRDYRFTRRMVREHTGLGNTQLKVHMQRLEELEYLLAHHARRGQQYVYELVYDGQGKDGQPFLPNLLAVDTLPGTATATVTGTPCEHDEYDRNWSGQKAEWSAPSRPQVGGVSGGCRVRENPTPTDVFGRNPEISPKNAHLEPPSEERIVAAAPSYLKAE